MRRRGRLVAQTVFILFFVCTDHMLCVSARTWVRFRLSSRMTLLSSALKINLIGKCAQSYILFKLASRLLFILSGKKCAMTVFTFSIHMVYRGVTMHG